METFESKIEGFDNPEVPEDTQATEGKKRRPVVLIVVGIVAAFALVAGAVFVASRFINPDALRGGPGGLFAGPGGGQRVSMMFKMEPAEELPDTPPDLVGQFSRRDDNSLYITKMTEGMQSGVAIQSGGSGGDDGGMVQSSNAPSGPEVEVVVTADTIIYQDVTAPPDPSQAGEEQSIKQVVEQVDTLDGIGSDSMLQVWGEMRGDRLIASVIFYSAPFIISVPAR